jgi:hypothetical protein
VLTWVIWFWVWTWPRTGGFIRLFRETLLDALFDFLSEEVAFVFLSAESSTIRLVVPQVDPFTLVKTEAFRLFKSLGWLALPSLILGTEVFAKFLATF